MSSISKQDISSMKHHLDSILKNQLEQKENEGLAGILALAKRLRDSQNGCPWDKIQTIQSFAECITEEAAETVESIKNNDMNNLEEELGDLLFTVLFTINMCAENKITNLEKVSKRVLKKLVFRHPHVFGKNPKSDISSEEAFALFQEAKKLEKLGRFD